MQKGEIPEVRGNANAMITADMTAEGDYTRVVINTDLKIAGKVAQFGKGVIGDVSKKLIDQFVECIEDKIAHLDDEDSATDVAPASAEMPKSAAATSAATATAPVKRTFDEPEEEHEALDLMDAAGGAMVKRLAPIGAGAALIALIIWLITRG